MSQQFKILALCPLALLLLISPHVAMSKGDSWRGDLRFRKSRSKQSKNGWDSSSSSSKSDKSGYWGSDKSGKSSASSGDWSSSNSSDSKSSKRSKSRKASKKKWKKYKYSARSSDVVYSEGGNLGGWKADGWDSDDHYKGGISYIRSEVVKLIEDSKYELIPKFLRLGFHDCVGGCDGCVDLTNPDNKGLREPIEAIGGLVRKFRNSLSRADIWALATLVAADMAVVHGRPGGLRFPMRYIGRRDCNGANDIGLGGPHVNMPGNDLVSWEESSRQSTSSGHHFLTSTSALSSLDYT